jgi:hypothetical protein
VSHTQQDENSTDERVPSSPADPVHEQERQEQTGQESPSNWGSRRMESHRERFDEGGLKLRGVMLWFNPEKRHGFVRTEEGERLRIDVDGFAPGHLLGDRCAGIAVEFEREPAEVEGEYRAVSVRVVDDASGRRARSRRRGG